MQNIQDNKVDIDQAMDLLRDLPYQDLGIAKLDHHRPLRTGFAEVVLGKGKTPEQISQIVFSLKGRGHPVLVTKTDSASYQSVLQRVPEAIFNELAGAIVVEESVLGPKIPGVLVISAKEGDLAAAEEAVLTAELMSNQVIHLREVETAGLQMLVDEQSALRAARVIVVAARMDAALAGLISGLTAAPVIAVPTSNGYGASLDGPASLLPIFNSHAPGVALVNIDNGFGAGYLASQINHLPPVAERSE